MFMLWQYAVMDSETDLSKHGRRMLADLESIIFIFQIKKKRIEHALSPWPPVDPLTTHSVLLRL